MEMKLLLTILIPSFAFSEAYNSGQMLAHVVPLSVSSEVHLTLGDNFFKGASGRIYRCGWGPYTVQNSATHTNITAAELPALAAQLPTLGKSVAISGIDNPEAFMAAFGLVRCDADGNPIQEGQE